MTNARSARTFTGSATAAASASSPRPSSRGGARSSVSTDSTNAAELKEAQRQRLASAWQRICVISTRAPRSAALRRLTRWLRRRGSVCSAPCAPEADVRREGGRPGSSAARMAPLTRRRAAAPLAPLAPHLRPDRGTAPGQAAASPGEERLSAVRHATAARRARPRRRTAAARPRGRSARGPRSTRLPGRGSSGVSAFARAGETHDAARAFQATDVVRDGAARRVRATQGVLRQRGAGGGGDAARRERVSGVASDDSACNADALGRQARRLRRHAQRRCVRRHARIRACEQSARERRARGRDSSRETPLSGRCGPRRARAGRHVGHVVLQGDAGAATRTPAALPACSRVDLGLARRAP